jgi:hypothetical protein
VEEQEIISYKFLVHEVIQKTKLSIWGESLTTLINLKKKKPNKKLNQAVENNK